LISGAVMAMAEPQQIVVPTESRVERVGGSLKSLPRK
jgi:hypothetical protein